MSYSYPAAAAWEALAPPLMAFLLLLIGVCHSGGCGDAEKEKKHGGNGADSDYVITRR